MIIEKKNNELKLGRVLKWRICELHNWCAIYWNITFPFESFSLSLLFETFTFWNNAFWEKRKRKVGLVGWLSVVRGNPYYKLASFWCWVKMWQNFIDEFNLLAHYFSSLLCCSIQNSFGFKETFNFNWGMKLQKKFKWKWGKWGNVYVHIELHFLLTHMEINFTNSI